MNRESDPFNDDFFGQQSQPKKAEPAWTPPASPYDNFDENPNPYSAPTFDAGRNSQYNSFQQDHYVPSSSLGARLGGALMDVLVTIVSAAPGAVFLFAVASQGSGGDPFEDNPLAIVALLTIYAGMFAVTIIQWVLISTRGQTIGKYVVGTKIVRIEDLGNPGFVKGVILRGWVPGILSAIPCGIGFIFSIVNICYIFGEERRCVHDHIAGTRVIDAEPGY